MVSTCLHAECGEPTELPKRISRLGITEERMRSFIMSDLLGNGVMCTRFSYNSKKLQEEKLTLAKDLILYIRYFTESAEFRERYASIRLENKPLGRSVHMTERQIGLRKKNLREAIALYEMLLQSAMKHERPMLEDQRKLLLDQLLQLEDPEKALTQWNERFPEDPRLLVYRSLEKYLQSIEQQPLSALRTYNAEHHSMFLSIERFAGAPDLIRIMAARWKQELQEQLNFSGNP